MKKNSIIIKLVFAFAFLITNLGIAQMNSWQQTTTPPAGPVKALASIGTNVFAALSNGGVYYSSDGGLTWTQRNGAYPTMEANSLATNGNDLFVGTSGGGPLADKIFKSSDFGITWINVTPPGISYLSPINSIVVNGSDIYMATNGSGIYKSPLSAISPSTWTTFSLGLPNPVILSLAVKGASLYAGTYGDGVWVSSLLAPTWTSASNGIVNGSDYMVALASNGTDLFAGNNQGTNNLYRSNDSGANWFPSTFGSTYAVNRIHINGNEIYLGTAQDGVFLSTDNGNTWAVFNNGLTCQSISSFLQVGNTLYAGTNCGVWTNQIGPCQASVSFSMTKDFALMPAIVWNAYPNYPGNIIAANWSWGDGLNDNGLYPAHTYSAAGMYSICVNVTVACGATATACYNTNIYKSANAEDNAIAMVKVINPLMTAIKKTDLDPIEFKLFPNPNTGEFELKLGNIKNYSEILIYNVMGQVVYKNHETLNTNTFSKKINLNYLTTGTYFIRVNSENASYNSKFSINK